MHPFFKKSLPVAIAMACSAGAVQAADAEEGFHGYLRAGAGTQSGGGNQACYGLEGVSKYRFGNECELYGEFGYAQELARAANGARFIGTFMAAAYGPDSAIGKTDLSVVQAFVEAKDIPLLQGASAWVGRRYYDRPDIHVIDFKYLHGDGVGGGISGVGIGSGKLAGKFSYALFRNDVDQSVAATRHSFIHDGMQVNPNGSLKLVATIIRGDDQDKLAQSQRKVENGWSLSAVHKQANVLGGTNTLALQYGAGSGIKIGGTDVNAGADIRRTRVFDNMIWQFTPEFSGSLLGLWQRDKGDAGSSTWTSVGVRPVYAFNDNFKLIMDLGRDNIKPVGGGPDQKLTKITLAPALSSGKGFFARPELRAFVTYAKWNNAAQQAADLVNPGSTLSSTGAFGGATNGTSFGLQLEAWF